MANRKASQESGLPYPTNFTPSAYDRRLAAELGVDLSLEGPQFQNFHLAERSRRRDWHAALRAWIRNAARDAMESRPGSGYWVADELDGVDWNNPTAEQLAAQRAFINAMGPPRTSPWL